MSAVRSVLLFLLAVPFAEAQVPSIYVPTTSPLIQDLPLGKELSSTPPEFHLEPLTREQHLVPQTGIEQSRVGINRALPGVALMSGEWTQNAAGQPIWRLRIQADDATGLRLHFTNFSVGRGKVWLHDGSARDQVFGPYTDKGRFGDGDFWTEMVFGSSMDLEYDPADDSPPDMPFQAPEIFYSWLGSPKAGIPNVAAVATGCFLDETCYDVNTAVHTAMLSTVYLVFSDHTCTGTMINDRNSSLTPYLLTAGHCVETAADAREMLAVFQFHSSSCTDFAVLPALDYRRFPQVSGATLLDRDLHSTSDGRVFLDRPDFAFVVLNQRPSGSYYAGWNTTYNIGDVFYSTSHPRNLPMVFAKGTVNKSIANDFFEFQTFQGKTDHGSSGSGVFDETTHLYGLLSGATNTEDVSACTTTSNSSVYTRFFSVYPRISSWLGTGVPPDDTGPQLTIISHTNGQSVSGPTITLSGTATDAGTGNNGISSVTLNGIRAGGDTATGSGTANWIRTITLTAGANTITVVAKDNSTNLNATTITITIIYTPDTLGPQLTITSHTNGQTVSTSSIILSGTATDSEQGNNGILSITVNNVRATGDSATGSGAANWSRAMILSTGTNTITVTAKDNSANQNSTTITLTITLTYVDPPNCTITSPSDGQTFYTDAIVISGTAADPPPNASGVTSVTVNQVRANGGVATGSETANWSLLITLVAGSNRLTVVCRDGGGNEATSAITLTHIPDTTGPALVITSHSDGQSVYSDTITLAGTARDPLPHANGVSSVMVNGLRANGDTARRNETANWSRLVVLNPGVNSFTVEARDGKQNPAPPLTIKLIRGVDSTPPSLTITSHSNGQTVSTQSITLAGVARDLGPNGNGVSFVMVNSRRAVGDTASGTRSANWAIPLTLTEGSNNFSVVVQDGKGNAATHNLTLQYAPPSITTFAGPLLPVGGVKATTQAIDNPTAVVADSTGGVYIASSSHNRIYRITQNGMLEVVAGNGTAGFGGDQGPAGSARLHTPMGLAMDRDSNLLIADQGNNRIRKVSPNGNMTTIAGNGSVGFGGDGGIATSASLNSPVAVAVDGAGNLFIADQGNNLIRKVTVSGTITTVAGNGTAGFTGDGGAATSARLQSPSGIAVDKEGNLFIADQGNNVIRKVTPKGLIGTVAGTGEAGFAGDGGLATAAKLDAPAGLAVDSAGNLFIADLSNNRVRRINSNGMVSTIAGTGFPGFGGDGLATSAHLYHPSGVAVDTAGNIFIADSFNNRIRKVIGNVIVTIAGSATTGFAGDGDAATASLLSYPTGVAADAAGNLFIADRANNRVRQVSLGGIITTIAGIGTADFDGDGGFAIAASINSPAGVAVDGEGDLFIADTNNSSIRKVTPDGRIVTVAGIGIAGFSGDGGLATGAMIHHPTGVAVDTFGNLFIADQGNNRIRKVSRVGIITTVAGSKTAGFSGDGGPAISARLQSPRSVAVDSQGNLFIADYYNNRIREVTANGIITTIAGTGVRGFSGDGGPAATAELSYPSGVTVHSSGTLFIADEGNHRIRRMSPGDIVTTVAGIGIAGFSGDGGQAISASLSSPTGVTMDGAGNLFIADQGNNRIRTVRIQPPVTFSIVDRGGISLASSGTSPALTIGHATIRADNGSTIPSGLAIFGVRRNGVLVSEASVPASSLLQSGRIYAETNGGVNTGIAMANPNNKPVTVSFFFTDSTRHFGNGILTIPPNGQIAKFLNEAPFNGPASLNGTLTFNSSEPISVIALRGLTNERHEFLITTLPVADLNAPPLSSNIVFSQFAEGAGWTTQIVLVNPTDNAMAGSVQFRDPSGQAVTLTANGRVGSNFAYDIPGRSSQKFQTPGSAASLLGGSVNVVPNPNTPAPSGVAIFSLRNRGMITTEAAVPAVAAGTAFALYAEAAGDFSQSVVGSLQTGFAITNVSNTAATVRLELNELDGSSSGLVGNLSIPANGRTATFLNEVSAFGSLQPPFQGLLHVSSSTPVSVVGLRARYNERGDFLITTTPPANENAPRSSTPLFFPHIADGEGYSTQFVLFGSQPGLSSSGTLHLFSSTTSGLQLTPR